MADGEGGTGAATAGGEALAGNGGGEVTTQPWVAAIEGIPDDLKADPTINRYENPVDALKGLLHHKQVASSRLVIPGAEAKPEDWVKVFDALGRPKAPTDYKIPLPEGVEKSALAEAFAPKAHDLGLLPGQVEGVATFWNEQAAATEAAYYAKGAEEIDAVKAELGAEFEAKREAAKAAFGKFFDVDDADMLDRLVGSGKLVRGGIKLAEAMGEHRRIDGDGGELKGEANAQAQLDALNTDATWRAKFNAGEAAAVATHKRLLAAATAQSLAAAGLTGGD